MKKNNNKGNGEIITASNEQSLFENNNANIKDLILPTSVDASQYDYLQIFSKLSRYVRSFYVTTLPMQTIFPYFLKDIYNYGNTNTSVYISPIPETIAQNDLNKTIVELQAERIGNQERGDLNRDFILAAKQEDAEIIRDEIAEGYNNLFEATIITTLFAYSKKELDKMSELLSLEAAKAKIGLKGAWANQEEAFQSNLPLNDNVISRKHTFDRGSMASAFPFITSEIGHDIGVPIGINKQTNLPIIFDNFNNSLTNYNMLVFGNTGSGKTITLKTIAARSALLMGIESVIIDAKGEYTSLAESLYGTNITLSPKSGTVINIFDVEPEVVRDEITGKERYIVNIENKIEDVTQVLLTMVRGATKTSEIKDITKQVIKELVAEEYKEAGINTNVDSLFDDGKVTMIADDEVTEQVAENTGLGRKKKVMPTIGSWYERILKKLELNIGTPDYQNEYNYLIKSMKQYCKQYNGSMSYFDGQSTLELPEGSIFINIDISKMDEKFAKPLAQQILLAWIWEKYVKKNSENRANARQKRVLIEEAWMLLDYPEAVQFLNTMAARTKKRNVALAIVSRKFQEFYDKQEARELLNSSEIKLLLSQDKSEIGYLKEIFKLSEGETEFLLECVRGEGVLKIGQESAIVAIKPTQKELQFVEKEIFELSELDI